MRTAGARERIAPEWGGGWIVTGECGRPHLKGPTWSWWRCKPCKRAQTAASLRAVDTIRLNLYYPADGNGGAMPSAG